MLTSISPTFKFNPIFIPITAMKQTLPTSSALDRLLKLAESAATPTEREAIMSSVKALVDEEVRIRKVEERRDKIFGSFWGCVLKFVVSAFLAGMLSMFWCGVATVGMNTFRYASMVAIEEERENVLLCHVG